MFIRSGVWVIISSINKLFRRYAKSLRLRLFLIMLLIGLVPEYLMNYWIMDNYERQSVHMRSELIRSRSELIVRNIASSGYLSGNREKDIDNEIMQLGTVWGGRVVVVSNNFRIMYDTYDIDEGKILIAPQVISAFEGDAQDNYNHRSQFLEVTVPVYGEQSDEIKGVLIISTPTNDLVESMQDISHMVQLFQLLLAVIIFFTAWYASRLLVKPFGKVTQFLDEKGGFLDEDISIPEYTETQLLADAYNRMRQRMQAQENSRQEFVSNVSHELKTPLTSMKVLADSLVATPDVPAELYREFMADITEEIDRENKIITDLLSLVKMDRSAPDINIKETNINDLIDLILKRLRPIAVKQNIELVQENFKPVLAEVDETKLTLAISNLVENGIKYNHPDGWVHVSLNTDNTYFYVKVEDSGMGIPEEAQQFIFERFYRVDKSHSREIGGTGLGLAITKNAILMHHGAIKVHSKEGEGTTFTVRIPIRFEADSRDLNGDIV